MQSLLSYDVIYLVALFAIMIFAGLVHGTLGLGFPMVATPLLAIFMDVRSAILITLIPTLAVNIISIARSVDSKGSLQTFQPLLLFTLLGSILGASVIAIADPAPFRILLAALILLYLVSTRLAQISPQWLQNNRFIAMMVFGLAAGFSGGTTNVMVAVLIIYFLSLNTARSTMIPVLNSCFFIGKSTQIVILTMAGFFGIRLAIETVPLALVAIAALLIGQKLQSKFDQGAYQAALRKLLVVLAIVLVFQFMREMQFV